MSKKKDREDTTYRFCPQCGNKTIIVSKARKYFKYKTLLNCYRCKKIYYLEQEKTYE